MYRSSEVVSNDEIDSSISQGAMFNSYGEFEKCLEEFCCSTYTHLRVRDSKKNPPTVDLVNFPKKRVRYACVYFGNPETIPETSKSAGKRPRQSYFASNCPFKLVVTYSHSRKCYTITTLDTQHMGHAVNKLSFQSHPKGRRLNSEPAKKYVHYMVDMNVAKQTIKKEIRKETGQNVKTMDLFNMVKKYKMHGLVSDLEASISRLEEENKQDIQSCLKIHYEESVSRKVVKCIFWQSGSMKKLLRDFGSVIFMDTTYNLTNRGYGLVTVSIKDNHDEGKLAAWALVSEESKHILSSVLKSLRDNNPDSLSKIQYVIIDKDFSEIASLSEVLPRSHIIICRYHAIKAVKRRIGNIHLPSNSLHIKEILSNHFIEMLYSGTELQYTKAWESTCDVSSNLVALEEYKTYLETFWHNIREHWAFYILRQKPLFNSFTNNRSEALHKNIKDCIKKHSKFESVVTTLLKLGENQKFAHELNNFESDNKVYCPSNIVDAFHSEIVALGNLLVTRKVLTCLEDQYHKSKMVNLSHLNCNLWGTVGVERFVNQYMDPKERFTGGHGYQMNL